MEAILDKPNYVAKAKQLIGSAVRTTALVIMPLAAAVTARADIIAQLPTGNFGCLSSNTEATCPSGAGDSQLQSVNSIQGVKLFTGGFVDIFNPSGGGSPDLLLLSAYGNFSGSLSGGYQMPLYYDFTLSGSGTDLGATAWTMAMELLVGGADVGQFTISGSGVGTFSGYGSLTVSSGGVASGANLVVAAAVEVAESSGATDMQVNVPAASTDFNAVVPEPATGGLVAAALAALGLATRFRRKRQ